MIYLKKSFMAFATLLLGGGLAMTSAGCASSANAAPTNLRAGVHPDATLVSSGTAPTFAPTEQGRIYVYDATDNERLGIYSLRRDQQFVLDPKTGRATIDGNEVVIDDVERGHVFQIYFEPDVKKTVSGGTSGSSTTIDRSITVYKEDPDATRKANQNR